MLLFSWRVKEARVSLVYVYTPEAVHARTASHAHSCWSQEALFDTPQVVREVPD
jgi:hypothetical protein